MSKPYGPLIVLIFTVAAFGRSNKSTAIDDFCVAVRHEFLEATPRYFSGPTPWVQLDRVPDEFADTAIATVYTEGRRVIWVVLELSGPRGGWFETTHYFFDDAGTIKKRERLFEHLPANVRIEESTYFEKGRVIKTRYRHAALSHGKENWDEFYDPHAPEYTSTADLPVLFLMTEFQPLAALGRGSGLCTRCTKPARG